MIPIFLATIFIQPILFPSTAIISYSDAVRREWLKATYPQIYTTPSLVPRRNVNSAPSPALSLLSLRFCLVTRFFSSVFSVTLVLFYIQLWVSSALFPKLAIGFFLWLPCRFFCVPVFSWLESVLGVYRGLLWLKNLKWRPCFPYTFNFPDS